MTHPASSSKHRVLVVEESSDEAARLADLLAPSFEVSVVSSAADAVDFLRTTSVHVVCSGDVTSMDMVTFLRRAMSVPDPPCLLMLTTATEMRDQKLEGLSGVMMKPFDPQTLISRVRRLTRVAEMRRRVSSAQNAIQKRRGGKES